jgi:hypothetical protein
VALREIAAGEELLINYGYEQDYWGSKEAGEDYVDATTVAHEWDSYTTIPGCHSMMTEIVDGKVYATQFIQAGDLVEISRALAVRLQFAKHPNMTKYVWLEEHTDMYGEEGGGTGMVLLGHGALYGSPPQDDLTSHNLRYGWYTYDPDKVGNFYWEDLVQTQTAMVALIATRDIELNEELTVPLRIDPVTGQKNVFNRMLQRRRG